jgi:Protein of unknown function (DUF3142)
MQKLPGIVLWAWERPETLDFVNPQTVAVAFLAKTISLRGNQVGVRPRLQGLTVAKGTRMIAVARIESDRAVKPVMSDLQLESVVSEISALARLENVAAVQIDFDASRSEREFYRQIIVTLRKRLPESTSLSITALASWCKGDDWLSDLPIDEVVPMLFRMGVDRAQIASQLESGSSFTAKQCQTSAGVSIDEPIALNSHVDRLYIFNPKSWSQNSFDQAMESYQR